MENLLVGVLLGLILSWGTKILWKCFKEDMRRAYREDIKKTQNTYYEKGL